MPFDGITLPQAARDLLAAKRYIEEHGWCSDAPARGETVCVVQAVGRIIERHKQQVDSAVLLLQVIDPNYGGTDIFYRLGRWNDIPGRTLEEVYAAFDRAVELAIEGEG